MKQNQKMGKYKLGGYWKKQAQNWETPAEIGSVGRFGNVLCESSLQYEKIIGANDAPICSHSLFLLIVYVC